MLGIQVHISHAAALAEQVAAVENDDDMPTRKKPKYGLWTSSWRQVSQDSGWIEWCRGSDFTEVEKGYWFLLTPREDVKLYEINTYADLERLVREYGYETRMYQKLREAMPHDVSNYLALDFERLAREYDGVHLTERGNARLHLSYPLDLNSWDSESTLWFRWRFTEVKRIAPVVLQEAVE
jgi:hypothetical protein